MTQTLTFTRDQLAEMLLRARYADVAPDSAAQAPGVVAAVERQINHQIDALAEAVPTGEME
jgi:hypothetical protein